MPSHPQSFHTPIWHYKCQTPIIDNKYVDRTTGNIRSTANEEDVEFYAGPPAVDIIISNIHANSNEGIVRGSGQFPMEVLLGHMMKIVGERNLEVDMVVATKYAIRVTLAHGLTKGEFDEVGLEMCWPVGEEEDELEVAAEGSEEGKGKDG